MTDPENRLAAALAKVQAELPRVEKNRTAEVRTRDGGTYTYAYADLADVSAAIMPLLGRNGLAFTCRPTEEDGKFGLAYQLLHESGASIEGWYPVERGTPQTTGGLITYARRYVLCALTGVAAEEDVDARGDGAARRPRPQTRSDSTPQRTAQRRQTPAAQAAGTPSRSGEPAIPPPARPVTMPPLPGEDNETRMVTGAQLTKIHLQMRDIGYVDDSQKAERLKLASRIVGRELGSSKELTRQEASRLIDFIEQNGTDYPALEAALQ